MIDLRLGDCLEVMAGMDDTGIHVFDENALAYLEKSGAVIY